METEDIYGEIQDVKLSDPIYFSEAAKRDLDFINSRETFVWVYRHDRLDDILIVLISEKERSSRIYFVDGMTGLEGFIAGLACGLFHKEEKLHG